VSRRTIACSENSSNVHHRSPLADQTALDALVAEARSGSAQAMGQLLEQLSEHLWAELGSRRRYRKTSPSHGSSDLVQDTLIRVREHFSRFDSESFADFKRWARTLLYRRRQEWTRNHQARNTERHKRMIWNELRTRSEKNGSGENILPVEEREEHEKAYFLFQALKPHEQFVINLRLLNSLSYKEISAMTGSTEDAARMAYDRAVARLRTNYHRHDK